MRKTIACALLGALVVAWPLFTAAQSQRPIRIIVASAPGGPSDVQARLITPRTRRALRGASPYAKQNPGKVNVAIPGATGQLAGDALWKRLQISLTDVNYKGSAPSEMALLGGECQISMLTPLAAMNHLQSGKLKAYGITSPQRHPLLPNLPTIAEQGVTGYDFQFWNGLFAPAKTPPRVVRSMNKAVLAALHSPEVSERFAQLGLVVVASSPEQFAQVVKDDVEKYRKVILESGIPRL